jgi:hypothetical protein
LNLKNGDHPNQSRKCNPQMKTNPGCCSAAQGAKVSAVA